MTKLTKDEIEKAAESIPGWSVADYYVLDKNAGARFHHRLDGDTVVPTNPERWKSDALALLEATGEDFEIQRHRSGWSVGFVAEDWLEHDPDFPTAAVRAVTGGEPAGGGEEGGAQVSFYLIANPKNGTVVRRSHSPASADEMHLMSLRVGKTAWKSYRAGDLVNLGELYIEDQHRWLDRVRAERSA